jgi:hypothetical protein
LQAETARLVFQGGLCPLGRAWIGMRIGRTVCFSLPRCKSRLGKLKHTVRCFQGIGVACIQDLVQKALDLVYAGQITSSFFVNSQEPLANLLEVMRHLMSHNGHLKTAIIP